MKRQQIVAIGLGRFGSTIARTPYELGHQVLALNRVPAILASMVGHLTQVVQTDACDRIAMEQSEVHGLGVSIVAMGQDLEASVLWVVNLQRWDCHI